MGAYARLKTGAIYYSHRHSGKLKSPITFVSRLPLPTLRAYHPTWGAYHHLEVYTAKQWRRGHEAESLVTCDT